MSSEENTQSTPQYSTGDAVTVSRGIHRGRNGKIVDVGAAEYAVKFDSPAEGKPDIAVVTHGNVKDPQERTFTTDQVVAALLPLFDSDAALTEEVLRDALNQTPAL